jgi:hypothetical protein
LHYYAKTDLSYYTPSEHLLSYGGGSAAYEYDDLAIDCYEAEKYDMALEFAEKAIKDNILVTNPESKYAEDILMCGASGDTGKIFEIIIFQCKSVGKIRRGT